MKTAKFTLMFLACSAAFPALAQNASPQCGSTNFDQNRNVFTILNSAPGAVNQQCFLTVLPSGAAPAQSGQFPGPYLVEGSYVVDLSGGGGGGGGGGAGAARLQTVQYFSPGVYKLTIGTGGDGGSANGGLTKDGNPTSLTNISTGQVIAGFPGADVWRQGFQEAGSGRGGAASPGGTSGQDGQINLSESGQSTAGGNGGASLGRGGAGDSAGGGFTAAGLGDLGGGGGGGGGAVNAADAGGRGGHGFIKLALQTAAAPATPAAQVPTGAVAAASAQESTPAPVVLPMRQTRN